MHISVWLHLRLITSCNPLNLGDHQEVKYMHSTYCHIIDFSGFIYGTNMYIYLLYKYIKYVAYMLNLMGIHVSSMYLAITWEVCIAVGCALSIYVQRSWVYMSINMLVVWIASAVWQSYFSSNICLHRVHALYWGIDTFICLYIFA